MISVAGPESTQEQIFQHVGKEVTNTCLKGSLPILTQDSHITPLTQHKLHILSLLFEACFPRKATKIDNNVHSAIIFRYNATIFAYGQTGSGKTFTISGPQGQISYYHVDYRYVLLSLFASIAFGDSRVQQPQMFRYFLFFRQKGATRLDAARVRPPHGPN